MGAWWLGVVVTSVTIVVVSWWHDPPSDRDDPGEPPTIETPPVPVPVDRPLHSVGHPVGRFPRRPLGPGRAPRPPNRHVSRSQHRRGHLPG